MNESPTDATLEANAYAVAYRLLGDRAAAQAVAGISAQRLRQLGEPMPENWLALLMDYTITQTVGPAALNVPSSDEDPYHSLRAALRRRLERATVEERTTAALIHLAGYGPDLVAELLGCTASEVVGRAGVLAPPPGVAYRDLGDPDLTGSSGGNREAPLRPRFPHWTTIVAIAVILFLVLYATQCIGPRPTLVEEGGLGARVSSSVQVGDVADF